MRNFFISCSASYDYEAVAKISVYDGRLCEGLELSLLASRCPGACTMYTYMHTYILYALESRE